jgi:hypothetical protein
MRVTQSNQLSQKVSYSTSFLWLECGNQKKMVTSGRSAFKTKCGALAGVRVRVSYRVRKKRSTCPVGGIGRRAALPFKRSRFDTASLIFDSIIGYLAEAQQSILGNAPRHECRFQLRYSRGINTSKYG